jgi:hypothetical protein
MIHVLLLTNIVVLQPLVGRNQQGLGCSAFARHYSRNHYCFLFLRVLRCFSSPGLPSLRNNTSSMYWVVPFGNLRINSYLLIPVAYRSLSRPSSPLRAKAFSIRPYLLSLFSFADPCIKGQPLEPLIFIVSFYLLCS